MDTTAIDDHHHLFAGVAKDDHDLMEIWPEFVGIKMGHDFIEDARRAVLDRSHDTEQDPVGETAPGAILLPALAFEPFFAFDLAGAQRTGGQPIALGAPPPPPAGQGKAPDQGLILLEEDDLPLPCPVLQGGKFELGIGQVRRSGRTGSRAGPCPQGP